MARGFITPVSLHYVRNHGPVPKMSWDTHKLNIGEHGSPQALQPMPPCMDQSSSWTLASFPLRYLRLRASNQSKLLSREVHTLDIDDPRSPCAPCATAPELHAFLRILSAPSSVHHKENG
jgi:hypothetical protein